MPVLGRKMPPSGLRRYPVAEADGRAPIKRQAVAKIAREVPPDTDARLSEEPVEDRRQRVELIREQRDPLLQLVRRHFAWSKDRVDLAVVAVPIRCQQASGTDHLIEERSAGHSARRGLPLRCRCRSLEIVECARRSPSRRHRGRTWCPPEWRAVPVKVDHRPFV